MADVYKYEPTTEGQQLLEVRCQDVPAVYRVEGPAALPDNDGFVGWVEVLFYTRDMQGKQVDSTRRVRVNPGLVHVRSPGRIFYGGGTRAGDCLVERTDGRSLGEVEHFLTQYLRRPGMTAVPKGARAVIVEPVREFAGRAPLTLSFHIENTEVTRHVLETGGIRLRTGGATSIRIDTAPFPSVPELYWSFHWVMDL